MLVGTGSMVLAALTLLLAPYSTWWIVASTSLAGLTVGFGLTQAMNNVVAVVPKDRTASVSGPTNAGASQAARPHRGTAQVSVKASASFRACSCESARDSSNWSTNSASGATTGARVNDGVMTSSCISKTLLRTVSR